MLELFLWICGIWITIDLIAETLPRRKPKKSLRERGYTPFEMGE